MFPNPAMIRRIRISRGVLKRCPDETPSERLPDSRLSLCLPLIAPSGILAGPLGHCLSPYLKAPPLMDEGKGTRGRSSCRRMQAALSCCRICTKHDLRSTPLLAQMVLLEFFGPALRTTSSFTGHERAPSISLRQLCLSSCPRYSGQNSPVPRFRPPTPAIPFGEHVAGTLLAPGSGGLRLLPVLFLLCGFRLFRLFRFLLPMPFGLVFLAFLVAHGVIPFWCSPSHFAASATCGHPRPWAGPSVPRPTTIIRIRMSCGVLASCPGETPWGRLPESPLSLCLPLFALCPYGHHAST